MYKSLDPLPIVIKVLDDKEEKQNLPENLPKISLIDACNNGYFNVARTLIEAGADPLVRDAEGNTLIHLALKQDKCNDFLAYLLGLGLDASATNDVGDTPLHLIRAGHFNLLATELLLAFKGNLLAVNHKGLTPLHVAIRNPSSLELMAAEFCRRHPFTPWPEDKEGNSPLHLACDAGNVSAVEILSRYMQLTCTLNKKGEFPLGKLQDKMIALTKKRDFIPDDNIKNLLEMSSHLQNSFCLERLSHIAIIENANKEVRDAYLNLGKQLMRWFGGNKKNPGQESVEAVEKEFHQIVKKNKKGIPLERKPHPLPANMPVLKSQLYYMCLFKEKKAVERLLQDPAMDPCEITTSGATILHCFDTPEDVVNVDFILAKISAEQRNILLSTGKNNRIKNNATYLDLIAAHGLVGHAELLVDKYKDLTLLSTDLGTGHPLTMAFSFQQGDFIRFYLEKNLQRGKGLEALRNCGVCCIGDRDEEMVQVILDFAKTHQLSPATFTDFLQKAVEGKQAKIFTLLLQAGVPVTPDILNQQGKNFVHLICENGDPVLLKNFFQYANYDENQMRTAFTATDTEGYTPFGLACKSCHLPLVQDLLQNYAAYVELHALDAKDRNALHITSAQSYSGQTRKELERRKKEAAEIKASGLTPEQLQAGNALEKVFGTKVNPRLLSWLNPPIPIGAKPIVEEKKAEPELVPESLALIEFLANQQVVINLRDKSGQTPFLKAIVSNQLANAKKLLTLGLKINETDANGLNALDLVFKNPKREAIVLWLLEQKLNMTPNADDITALHYACGHGWRKTVGYLLQHNNANPISENKNKETPLEMVITALQNPEKLNGKMDAYYDNLITLLRVLVEQRKNFLITLKTQESIDGKESLLEQSQKLRRSLHRIDPKVSGMQREADLKKLIYEIETREIGLTNFLQLHDKKDERANVDTQFRKQEKLEQKEALTAKENKILDDFKQGLKNLEDLQRNPRYTSWRQDLKDRLKELKENRELQPATLLQRLNKLKEDVNYYFNKLEREKSKKPKHEHKPREKNPKKKKEKTRTPPAERTTPEESPPMQRETDFATAMRSSPIASKPFAIEVLNRGDMELHFAPLPVANHEKAPSAATGFFGKTAHRKHRKHQPKKLSSQKLEEIMHHHLLAISLYDTGLTDAPPYLHQALRFHMARLIVCLRAYVRDEPIHQVRTRFFHYGAQVVDKETILQTAKQLQQMLKHDDEKAENIISASLRLQKMFQEKSVEIHQRALRKQLACDPMQLKKIDITALPIYACLKPYFDDNSEELNDTNSFCHKLMELLPQVQNLSSELIDAYLKEITHGTPISIEAFFQNPHNQLRFSPLEDALKMLFALLGEGWKVDRRDKLKDAIMSLLQSPNKAQRLFDFLDTCFEERNQLAHELRLKNDFSYCTRAHKFVRDIGFDSLFKATPLVPTEAKEENPYGLFASSSSSSSSSSDAMHEFMQSHCYLSSLA